MGPPLTVIGRADCPWCDKVKALLSEHGISFSYIELSRGRLAEMGRAHGFSTVPQVFADDMTRRLGGYTEMKNLLERITP